jgi:hypothetical protein
MDKEQMLFILYLPPSTKPLSVAKFKIFLGFRLSFEILTTTRPKRLRILLKPDLNPNHETIFFAETFELCNN